ncbi:MAG TPA: alkaline phosphatase family protein, partial [Gemmataceae bacterium]|nr:alkaline phosphatase family protein [Gemmataceae bacterium]
SDGRILVPTNQILDPAGKQVLFPGRPVDLLLLDAGKTLVVKNAKDLVFIDTTSQEIRQTMPMPAGFGVVGLLAFDQKIYVTDARDHVRVAVRQANGTYAWGKALELSKPAIGGAAHPAGMARTSDREILITSTRGNNVQLINVYTGKVEQMIPVGVAPYTVCCPVPGKGYVSNWGGHLPDADVPQSKSSGTPTRVDSRGVASDGTVSVLALADGKWRQVKTIRVGLHPCGMIASRDGRFLYVANANSDTVSVLRIDTDEVVETILCRPEGRLPFGSGSNALALSENGDVLYVANGTNNCVAVIQLGAKASSATKNLPPGSRLVGLIPTGWYPGAVCLSADGKQLFVANVKGIGSLARQRANDKQPRPVEKGMNSHDHLGSVSIIHLPNAEQLASYTKRVNSNNRLAYSLAGLDPPRPDAEPVPIPLRHGEPSLFKHVVYIIKENRTYDQVLGDVKEGNGDAHLCIFGEEITPNHHKLAREFSLFDNFFCSGVLSADGHNWVNEAYVTDYLEKSFGNFTRSYPDDGSDPLALPSSGHLWDNALAHKKSLRNYGEYVTSTYPKGITWADVYADYTSGTNKVKIQAKANLKSLEPFTHPGYPWFPLYCPDVYRARLFLDDLKGFEAKNDMPHFIEMTLPCNHTDGTRPGMPTPRAMVADNDLALGRIVEAISKSKFWPETCIFVVEDDPQAGFDHVDGHRTVALVISPFTKRKFVDSTNYNQTGMVKTIELILGLPPMNQLDLSAAAMRNCFRGERDLTAYVCAPNKVPLDEMNPPLMKLTGVALHWAKKSLEMDLDDGDKADEGTFNRILWHAMRGDAPYPRQYAGERDQK